MTILPTEENFRRESFIKGKRVEFNQLLRRIGRGIFWHFVLGDMGELGLKVVQDFTPKETLPIEVENVPTEVNYFYLFLSQYEDKIQAFFENLKQPTKELTCFENIIAIKINIRK
jgi:hypothetical protein